MTYKEFKDITLNIHNLGFDLPMTSEEIINRIRGLKEKGYQILKEDVHQKMVKAHSMSYDRVPDGWYGEFDIKTPNNHQYKLLVDSGLTGELKIEPKGERRTTRPLDDILDMLYSIAARS